jgi:hypothetical protein
MLKKILLVALLALLPGLALAQTSVSRQPWFAPNNSWLDLGNGPTVVLALQGSGTVYTMLGSGVGSTSGSSTALTLTATAAASPPCVGCVISGTGITAGTTVAAFNGTTGVTLSAAMTVAASTALSWGMACPTSGQPNAVTGISSPAELRATGSFPPAAVPMRTYARLCVYSGQQSGITGSNFNVNGW